MTLFGLQAGPVQRTVWRVATRCARLAVGVLVAMFIATALVRWAPGYGIDERVLDPRYSGSAAAIAAPDKGLMDEYVTRLRSIPSGDWGESVVFGSPVRELLLQRIPVTANSVLKALMMAWSIGLLLCFASQIRSLPGLRAATDLLTAGLLCIPSALIAFAAVSIGASAAIGICVVTAPKIYRVIVNLIEAAGKEPWVASAQARGLSSLRILLHHKLRRICSECVVLAGVTVNLALGAAIPMEVLCDEVGLGQLAWRCALGRDLPVVVAVTAVIAAVTMLANLAAETAADLLVQRAQ